MKRNLLIVALFLAVLAGDQASKLAVTRTIPLYNAYPVVGQVVVFRPLYNSGALFGMFRSSPDAVFAVKTASFALLIFLAGYLLFSRDNRLTALKESFTARASLAMILGAAAGNYIDRLRVGAVIDFIDIGFGGFRWYTFNLADAFLVAAALILALHTFSFGRRHSESGPT